MKNEIALILFDEENEKTGQKTGRKLVSHGINIRTLETVTLPPETPQSMGTYKLSMNEWFLK